MEFLLMRCAERAWAVPFDDVSEVVGAPLLTPLPLLPMPVRGVMTLRGRAVPAIDLGLLGGVASTAAVAVVLAAGAALAAVLVDAIEDVRSDEPGDDVTRFDVREWMERGA